MAQTIGQQLKEARVRKGLSLEDVHQETKISREGLEGMERDDFSVFPSSAYGRSFLALYSRYLGVDASEVIGAMHHRGNGRRQPPDFLETDLHLHPSDATIPIVKHRVVERKPPRSPAGLVLSLMLVVLIPTVYYVGKRVGLQEHNQLRPVDGMLEDLPLEASPGADSPEPLRARVIESSPLDQYGDRPVRTYEPNPELNALIGVGEAPDGRGAGPERRER